MNCKWKSKNNTSCNRHIKDGHTCVFHKNNKKIGAHVAGKDGINLAIECGVDVFHHAHGINYNQIKIVKEKGISIVATPLGGTHLTPNLPQDILNLVKEGINVSIATDA